MPKLDFAGKCYLCSVAIDEMHLEGCGIARCSKCGLQAIGCGCDNWWDVDLWSGFYPGDIECARLGYWCKFDNGWKTCDESDPNAVPDLNKYIQLVVWKQGG